MEPVKDRLQLVAELAASPSRVAAVLAALAEGVVLQSRTHGVVAWNPAAEKILGVEPGRALAGCGPEGTLSVVRDDGSPWPAATRPGAVTLATGKPLSGVVMGVRRSDGALVWLSLNTRPIFELNDSAPSAVVVSFVDVTEKRLAEQALAEQQVRLRRQARLLELAHDAILVRSLPEDRIVYWNRGATEIYGWSAAEACGRVSHELLSTTFPLALVEIREELSRRGRWEGELTHRCKNGAEALVLSRWVLMRDDEGHPVGVLEINTDVTARRAAEEAQREVESHFRAVFEHAAIGICRVDPEGIVLAANPALERMLGRSADELVGGHFTELAHPADRASVTALFERLRRREAETLHRELRYRGRGGDHFHGNLTVSVVRDEAGDVVYFVVMLEDITERKRMEDALRQSEERFWQGFEQAPIGMVMMGPKGLLERTNRAFSEMVGRSSAELARLRWKDLAAPRDDLPDPDFAQALEAGSLNSYLGEQRLRRSDGDLIEVVVAATVVRDREGRPSHHFCQIEDVTQRKLAQQRLQEALVQERRLVEELRELDRVKSDFVSRVSHELRTPLTSIVGYLELLGTEEAGALTAEQIRMLEVIDRNARRLLTLIEDLLTMGRIEQGAYKVELAPVDLARVVEAAHAAMLPSAAAKDLELSVELAPDLGLVEGDPRQLDRALLNLLSNAIKFTPAGGRVWLRAWRQGSLVRLVVGDSGIGIAAEDRERLFTRFFRAATADRLGIQGTGLGLAIVKSIVDHHGGNICIDSEPGRGTSVEITLRCVKSEPSGRSRAPTGGPVASDLSLGPKV